MNTASLDLCLSNRALNFIGRNFFGRRWTEAETEALQQRRIFLVLHDITPEELQQIRPALADRYSLPSSIGIDRIVEKLLEAIRRPPRQTPL